MSKMKCIFMFCLLCALPFATSAHASVVITGTRIVYEGGKREQEVRLTNNGSLPALVQVWIDPPSENNLAPQSASGAHVPFTVVPPIFRIEPQKGQTVRVVYTGESIPLDKESLFWFNALEIPPMDQNTENKNQMQISFRTRIKLFFRPQNLSEKREKLPQRLTWRIVDSQSNSPKFEVTNPTPYFASFADAVLVTGTEKFEIKTEMLAPGQTLVFPLAEPHALISAPEKIQFHLLNDYGAPEPGEALIGK